MKKKVILSVVLSIFGIIALASFVFAMIGIVGHLKDYFFLKSEYSQGEYPPGWYDDTFALKIKYVTVCILFLLTSLYSVFFTTIGFIFLFNKRTNVENNSSRATEKRKVL